VRKSLKKDERTADLKTVFTEAKGHVNPHSGESEDGWYWTVCRYVGDFVVIFLIVNCITGLTVIQSMSHFSGVESQHVVLILLGNAFYMLHI
jgi:hypothetical protein